MPMYRLIRPFPVDPKDREGTEDPFKAGCIEDAVNFVIARFEQWPSIFNARGGQTASVCVVNDDDPADTMGRHDPVLFRVLNRQMVGTAEHA